jgi:recombination protein RecA
VQTNKPRRIDMSTLKEKLKVVQTAVAAIEKQFGKGAIMSLGGEVEDIAVIPTGSVGLDLALGVGGLPRGRVVEIFGPESSGKTTLTLHAIAQAQKAGGVCAFIDAEHALDVTYARKLGVRTEDLLVSQPDHGEQALEIADKLVGTGAIDLIVIDSVAALVPKAEIEGEMGDSHMGLQARLMSQALRKLTAATCRNNTCVVFINQLRQKIGVVYGNPETTTGGNALKFYASVRLDIRKTGVVKNGEQAVGNKTRVKVVKNKVAPPFRECEFEITYGTGISTAGEIVDLASEAGLIEKSGAYYAWNGERIAQGRDKACQYLGEHPAPRRRAARQTGRPSQGGERPPGSTGKARRGRILDVFNRGATQPAGMDRVGRRLASPAEARRGRCGNPPRVPMAIGRPNMAEILNGGTSLRARRVRGVLLLRDPRPRRLAARPCTDALAPRAVVVAARYHTNLFRERRLSRDAGAVNAGRY